MSMYVKRQDGTLRKIAGYTIVAAGDAAQLRQGFINSNTELPANTSTFINISFTDTMPDTNYEVLFSNEQTAENFVIDVVSAKTTVGFRVKVTNTSNSAASIPNDSIQYTAFQLVPMEGYSDVINKIENPDTVPTENSTNMCESGGIYTAIEENTEIIPTSYVEGLF